MHVPSCFPVKENTWGVGFRLRRPPAKQQGSGSQGQPSPALPDCERGAGCENGLRSFPEFWPVGAGVCSPMSVSCPLADCSPQKLGWCLLGDGSSVLRCRGWLGWHCWGLGEEGLRTPNPASKRRRTRLKWVSGSGDPQQSSRAQGARGSPAQLCPTSSGGLGA